MSARYAILCNMYVLNDLGGMHLLNTDAATVAIIPYKLIITMDKYIKWKKHT